MQRKRKGIFARASILLLVLALVSGAAIAFAAAEEPYAEQWSMPMQPGDSLLVDMSSVDVIVSVHPQSEISAVFEGRRTPALDGTMPYIEVKTAGTQVSIKTIWPKQSLLSVSTGSLEGTLTLLVPDALLGDVDVRTFSGAVIAEGLQARQLSMDTSSGNVTAKNHTLSGDFSVNTFSGKQFLEAISAKDITLGSSSGNITGTGLHAQGAMDVETFSGHQSLTDGTAQDMHLHASSGNITGNTMTAAQDMTLDTFSGKQSLQGVQATTLNASASSGSLDWADITGEQMAANTFSGRITIAQAAFAGSVSLETSGGDMKIDGLSAAQLQADTFSGNIQASGIDTDGFQTNTSSGRCHATFVGGADVQAETFSGDVQLTFPADTGIAYTFDTFSGKATVAALEAWAPEKDGKSVSGTIGDGAFAVAVNTSSGDLHLIVEE